MNSLKESLAESLSTAVGTAAQQLTKDREQALRLEASAEVAGGLAVVVAFASSLYLIFVLGAPKSTEDFLLPVWPALTLLVAAVAVIVWAVIAALRCRNVLRQLYVEHVGPVASYGRNGKNEGVVTFADGYVAELGFAIDIEPGTCLTIWRDGWGVLKHLELKRA